MTVAASGSGTAPVASTDLEPYEAFADGRLWQRARKLHLFLVSLAATQVIVFLLDPGGFDRFQFGLVVVTLVFYSFGLLWHHRATRRARENPVLRIDASGLGVQPPEQPAMRRLRWHEIDGIAWRGLDEIGVRLQPRPEDDVAEVVSVPTGQLPEEAADRLVAAIEAHCGG